MGYQIVDGWEEYQEEAAEYFRSLGLEATTDVRIKGVRTNHDVDVFVVSDHVGFQITWIVECKRWKTRVSKLHVLALREIVQDVGADRGVLLSESGFQRGAKEAAELTNVQLSSLDELRSNTADAIGAMRVRDLYARMKVCKQRYWDIPKKERIKAGLRQGLFEPGYSGGISLMICEETLSRALWGRYPFSTPIDQYGGVHQFDSPQDVEVVIEELVSELEEKLDSYENNR